MTPKAAATERLSMIGEHNQDGPRPQSREYLPDRSIHAGQLGAVAADVWQVRVGEVRPEEEG